MLALLQKARCQQSWGNARCRKKNVFIGVCKHGFTSLKSKRKKFFSHTLNLPKTSFPMRANAYKREPRFVERTTTNLYRWQQAERRTNSPDNTFVLHDGPPYANGSLHLGHLLNKVLKDITNRYQMAKGKRVDYVPGWDCHGLPIELKVLQEVSHDKQSKMAAGSIRKRANESALNAACSQSLDFQRWGVMADWGNAFKDIETEGEETSIYKTMDKGYELEQIRVFREMLKSGLVYRGLRPVYWSPSSRTALAEAELEYFEHTSESVYAKFPFKKFGENIGEKTAERLRKYKITEDNCYALIWTTTPWSIPSNMALCINSSVQYSFTKCSYNLKGKPVVSYYCMATDRIDSVLEIIKKQHTHAAPGDYELTEFVQLFSVLGQELESTECTHPLNSERSVPVLFGEHVSLDAGTGIVHTAPGHGTDDYNVWVEYKKGGKSPFSSDLICPVDSKGCFTKCAGTLLSQKYSSTVALEGESVLGEGNRLVIKALKMAGCLIYQEPYRHRYPHDWRTKEPVIIRATKQWFADVGELQNRATKALKNVSMFPPMSANRLNSMIHGRKEWCISRQRVWGVPIPVLYHNDDDRILTSEESLNHIEQLISKYGSNCWWDLTVKDLLPYSLKSESSKWRKCSDTLDVWFDSGVSWAAVLQRRGLKMPADVYLEGSDQHRGWFQSSLLTKLAASQKEDEAPFQQLVTHGFVLDENGDKMSKSLGNVISPDIIINGGQMVKHEYNSTNKCISWPAYGVDVLRLWVASTDFSRDVIIGPTSIAQNSDFLRKIRNTIRFILGNLYDYDADFEASAIPDDEILEKLTPLDILFLYKLETFVADVEKAYSSYNFRKVYGLLQNFVNTELSSFYMDVSKDRLYCDPANSRSRRGCQYALHRTLTALVATLGPILPFTCEDIYQHRQIDVMKQDTQSPADKKFSINTEVDAPSVFTRSKWPTTSLFCRNSAVYTRKKLTIDSILEAWQCVSTVRDSAKQLLEVARKEEKIIGSSLEACIEISISDRSVDQTVFNSFLVFQPQLEDIFGASQVIISRTGKRITPSSLSENVVFDLVENAFVSVSINKADGLKCSRCWKISDDLISANVCNGTDVKTPKVCRRCSSIVTQRAPGDENPKTQ
jgi:isoleucyl-tRNA synthetase